MNELDAFKRLARGYAGNVTVVVPPVALTEFQALDEATKRLVLRFLASPDDDARWQQLADHPDSRQLSDWLLTLPRYQVPTRGAENDDWDELRLALTPRCMRAGGW